METSGLYAKFPLEIVLMVWKEAISSRGVHHFRIFPAKPDVDDTMSVEPWEKKTANDASIWRDRWNISQVDHLAREEYERWLEGVTCEGALWVAPFRQRKRDSTKHAIRAKVHGKQDLVVLTITDGYINFDLLDEDANKVIFRGLQRIALNWKQTETGRSWLITPFKCTCFGRVHDVLLHCPVKVAQFLRFFSDVQHFYFIFRITAKDVALPENSKRGRGNNTNTGNVVEAKKRVTAKRRVSKVQLKPKKPTADQLVEDVLSQFRSIAEKKKLEIWNDADRTYIEVEGASLEKLVKYSPMQEVTTHLKKEWRAAKSIMFTPRDKRKFAKTQFHYLVCRDRISRKK